MPDKYLSMSMTAALASAMVSGNVFGPVEAPARKTPGSPLRCPDKILSRTAKNPSSSIGISNSFPTLFPA